MPHGPRKVDPRACVVRLQGARVDLLGPQHGVEEIEGLSGSDQVVGK